MDPDAAAAAKGNTTPSANAASTPWTPKSGNAQHTRAAKKENAMPPRKLRVATMRRSTLASAKARSANASEAALSVAGSVGGDDSDVSGKAPFTCSSVTTHYDFGTEFLVHSTQPSAGVLNLLGLECTPHVLR